MPWRKTEPVLERMKFITEWAEAPPELSFTDHCKAAGISRETGYKWKKRFEEGGAKALSDRPPIAHHHPNATPEEIEDEVVAVRKRYPTWGPKKIKQYLERVKPSLVVPGHGTIGRIITRRGLSRPRKRRLKVPPSPSPLSDPQHPNELWTVDHKGDFPLADGRCYPLTIRDAASRYLLRIEASRSTSVDEAWPHFEAAFQEFGLPARIRSDGGCPFATVGLGGLSRLAVWWVKLGIELERIEPGHPEQNGGHERMHRDLKAEAVLGSDASFVEQQRCFDRFRAYFNHERPHEALEGEVPDNRYVTSWRTYPSRVPSPEYPADMEVRRVTTTGQVRWKSHLFQAGAQFAGEPVGIRRLDEQLWTLHFGSVLLAGLQLADGKLTLLRDTTALPGQGDRRN